MRKRKGFTLIELLVVVAIIALLISILLPSLSRARELSKRLVCAANIKGTGTSFKIYANDNEESWPVPTFNEANVTITWENFHGLASSGYDNGPTDAPIIPGPAVVKRRSQSSNITTTLSSTRSLWMLVRSGDVTPKQFICPSSGDTVEPEANIDLYYDFRALKNISYGYQVPFGPFDTRPSESIDPRMAVAADKGPYSASAQVAPDTNFFAGGDLFASDGGKSPEDWKTYNSPNHGGRGTGEGQNILYGDGHATFEKTPIAGVDNDNIYTHMSAVTPNNLWRLGGLRPTAGDAFYYPGKGAFTTTDSTTDSVVFP